MIERQRRVLKQQDEEIARLVGVIKGVERAVNRHDSRSSGYDVVGDVLTALEGV